MIPQSIIDRYEVVVHLNPIISSPEAEELWEVLDKFSITQEMLTDGGGNKSDIVKRLEGLMSTKGWTQETKFVDTHKIDYIKNKASS
jgi:hypothetical protein